MDVHRNKNRGLNNASQTIYKCMLNMYNKVLHIFFSMLLPFQNVPVCQAPKQINLINLVKMHILFTF